MNEYEEYVNNLRVADLKRVLREHGANEYGLRSQLVLRVEAIMTKKLLRLEKQQRAALQVPEVTSIDDEASKRLLHLER